MRDQPDQHKLRGELWALVGFVLAYAVFYFWPAFLNHEHISFLVHTYVPPIKPIGTDLQQMLSYATAWGKEHSTPFIGQDLYPPLTAVLFYPLTLLKFPLAYQLFSYLTLAAFLWLVVWLPSRIISRQSSKLVWGILVGTSLFSYGFTFEIERGQFNVLAVTAALAAAYLFHYAHKRWRILAYAFFVLAVQLKVYPFIFILLLIRDWRSWRTNLRRLAWLAATNFVLLYILGTKIAGDFWQAIQGQASSPFAWVGNHSIKSFVTVGGQDARFFWYSHYLTDHPLRAELMLFALLGLSLLLVIYQAARRNRPELNPYLLMNLTAGALLIPAVSHDYTLPLLVLPTILCLVAAINLKVSGWRETARLLIIAATTWFFFTTAVTFDYKGLAFNNGLAWIFASNLPAIMALAWLSTGLSFLSDSHESTP